MAKLPRVTAKVFASNAATEDIGQFGSALAGDKVLTSDISKIQELPAFETGWRGAVISDRNYPTLQEMNGLQKNFSQQIAYLLQMGVPEWDSETEYYVGSFSQIGGKIYKSTINKNINNNPLTDTTNWNELITPSSIATLTDVSLNNLENNQTLVYNQETQKWENQLSVSGLSLFDTIISDHILTFEESKGKALQGTYVYKASADGRYGYPTFYNKCVEEKTAGTATQTALGNATITMYYNANGHIYYDIADKSAVDAFFNTYGIADFYGIDTTNERVFLPRNNYFMQLTTDVSKINEFVEAGLPNVTGSFSGCYSNESGAFVRTTYHNSLSSGSTPFFYDWNFDASRSSSIYGNSTTVQPPASLKLLYYIVGNTEVEVAETEITDITTTENDTLPLFFNKYSSEDMTTSGAFVNASLGSYLSGTTWETAYNYLAQRLGQSFCKGIIKDSTATDITDYDCVINQTNQTFKLPLLNGEENLPTNNYINMGLPTNPLSTSTETFVAPTNGYIDLEFYKNSTGINIIIIINELVRYEYSAGSTLYNTPHYNCFVKKGDTIRIVTNSADITYTTNVQNFYYAQGNGNLYFKLSNAVQNLQILDVAGITNALNLKADIDLANVPDAKGILVESYVNGKFWYRKYSDGFCIQSGIVAVTDTINSEVPLLVTLKDINYTLLGVGVDTQVARYMPFMNPVSTSTFKIGFPGAGGTINVRWIAMGYYE